VKDTSRDPIRVLVVDDERGVRHGLTIRLNTEPDVEVAATAADGRRGIDLALDLRPDVVLMDARMPGMDGLAAVAHLREVAPRMPVVVLSLHDDAATRTAALEAGAAAFVSKHDGDAALLDALRQVTGR
jgi:DNA-binding NarL/FixJ family response regulator